MHQERVLNGNMGIREGGGNKTISSRELTGVNTLSTNNTVIGLWPRTVKPGPRHRTARSRA